jgi:hypothetical protein
VRVSQAELPARRQDKQGFEASPDMRGSESQANHLGGPVAAASGLSLEASDPIVGAIIYMRGRISSNQMDAIFQSQKS